MVQSGATCLSRLPAFSAPTQTNSGLSHVLCFGLVRCEDLLRFWRQVDATVGQWRGPGRNVWTQIISRTAALLNVCYSNGTCNSQWNKLKRVRNAEAILILIKRLIRECRNCVTDVVRAREVTTSTYLQPINSTTPRNCGFALVYPVGSVASQTQKPLTLLRISLSRSINLQIDFLLISKFRIAVCHR